MIVLDATIVNVALPSIQGDLGFTQASLTWVVNAYLIAFGSFLLLAGRLGDLVGRKKVFVGGLALFTTASVLCGLADDQTLLIAARFVQGMGGAVASSVIIAIIVTEFPRPREQAKAMGVFAFGGRLDRAAGRGRAHPRAQLALDLLHQPADRVAGDRSGAGPGRGERGARAAPGRRRLRLGADHGGDDARRLHDREDRGLRLGIGADARLRRPGAGDDRRFRPL
jgi:hypothetical protein